MLGGIDAVANIAVSDLAAAARFYEDTLGLTPIGGIAGHVIVFRSGGTSLNVYRSEFAGTNKATAVTWSVSNIEAIVSALKARGVAFECYDMPGSVMEGDVHVSGGMKVAWFRDLDGNLLNLNNGGAL